MLLEMPYRKFRVKYQVCLIHPFDPRGKKVGGLETYTRDFITFHPEDISILMIGVDEIGDLKLGQIYDLTFRGRRFKFLPILYYPETEMREAARSIGQSITFRFFAALLKYLLTVRRALSNGVWTIELRRMEFAIVPRIFGIPFVQMLHGEGSPEQPMDSLLRNYWYVQNINERLALRWSKKFLCVNSFITERIKREYPKYRNKVDTITTWANPTIFTPTPFRADDGIFKVVFCGRLDNFKVPPLIFKTLHRLHQELDGGVEFHYIGSSDPGRFPEFEAIRPFTVMRGYHDAVGIHEILGEIDAGILTSEFEGMPRFVLETLSSGRPVVSIDLPQLRPVIEDGVSGYLVPRFQDQAEQVEILTSRFLQLRSAINAKLIDPLVVHGKVVEYTPEALLSRVHQFHRDIQNKQNYKLAGEIADHRVCFIHPFDPRGRKVGGIETHLRQVLQYVPADVNVLFVGVDGVGDCTLGEIRNLDMGGRTIEFLPVARFLEEKMHVAAGSLARSVTMQFAAGLLRYFFQIRKALGAGPASVELQRFEFAIIPFLLRRPTLQIIHGEGSKQDKMDSLIKKYWFLHRLNEMIAIKLADQIVCVNPNIEAQVKKRLGKNSQRASFMPVPVDTKTFAARPFDTKDGIFRIVFAGRLDEFKDPPLMFRVLRAVHDRLQGGVEFHYIGTSEPDRFPEFALIKDFTVLQGYRSSQGVAEIVARCHAGILTSLFEGMPCYLLELISVGRPIVAVRLPQYSLVIEEGVSGSMVDRVADTASVVDMLAERLVAFWSAIQSGSVQPAIIHRKAILFSAETHLKEHYLRHEKLQLGEKIEPHQGAVV
jgi:glycosyltransferase involved in cell wall biosynthesis